MKYKLVLVRNASGGGNPDGMTAINFYTFSQAHASATEWVGFSAFNEAFLWDGTQWRLYP